jgi:hypothetical protein
MTDLLYKKRGVWTDTREIYHVKTQRRGHAWSRNQSEAATAKDFTLSSF